MRIFFIGASSFTGHIFVEKLSVNHEIFTPLSRAEFEYSGVTKQRISALNRFAKSVYSSPFGSRKFFDFLEQTQPDTICFHHAITLDYNNSSFDVNKALQISLHKLPIIENFIDKDNLKNIIITRSIVENEFNISPQNQYEKYARYKTIFASLIREIFSKFTNVKDFVIANPIGKLNNFKIIESFAHHYFNNQDFNLQDPYSIRDNIPIDLLAREYSLFVNQNKKAILSPKFNPLQNIELLTNIKNLFSKKYKSTAEININPKNKKSIFYGNDQIMYSHFEVEKFWEEFIDFLYFTYFRKSN